MTHIHIPAVILATLLVASPEQASAYVVSPANPAIAATSKPAVIADVTKVGSLTVPNVGIGTIAWSSNSLTKLENPDLETLVESACQQNGGFFDTGERYGSHVKTAMAVSYTHLTLPTILRV